MTIAELDLHVHSMYSYDSLLRPEKIVKTAKRRGLNGVAITDHGTIQGGLSTRKYNTNDFIVIIGAEIKTEIGDIIGLFLNEEIKSKDIWNVIDEIRDQDGLVVLPHPFRGHNPKGFNKDLLNKIDAIEGYNSRTGMSKNIQAQEFAKIHELPIIAGSDAHFLGEIGLSRTIVGNAFSEEDFRKSILNHNVRIIGSPSPLFFIILSGIIIDIKKKQFYKIPYTFLKSYVKLTKL